MELLALYLSLGIIYAININNTLERNQPFITDKDILDVINNNVLRILLLTVISIFWVVYAIQKIFDWRNNSRYE